MDCLFCQIVSGHIPADIVYQDDEVTAFRDINPQAPTHILVIPNGHVASVSDVSETEDSELLGRVLLATRSIAKTEGLKDFRLVINNGAEAGQTVFHLHVHLLGGRPLSWPPG